MQGTIAKKEKLKEDPRVLLIICTSFYINTYIHTRSRYFVYAYIGDSLISVAICLWLPHNIPLCIFPNFCWIVAAESDV